jgi:monoamine oxidase
MNSALVASALAAPNVLVVGGGLTGAAATRALVRLMPECKVVVWEALDTIGGRFHTEVTADGGARAGTKAERRTAPVHDKVFTSLDATFCSPAPSLPLTRLARPARRRV